MDPSVIVSLAGRLLTLVTAKEPGLTNPPTTDLLERVIKALLSGQGLTPDELGEDFAPARALFFIKSLLNFKGLPNTLSADNLGKLLAVCLGTPKSSNSNPLPPNRATIVPPGGGHMVDYLFDVDSTVLPPSLGLSGENFEELVDRAWFRWQDAIAPNRLRVRRRIVGDPPPNLVVRCGALDGPSNILGETTSTWSSSGPSTHTIVLDMSEPWTKAKLLATVIHEIGHALGLEHVNDPQSIMFESLNSSYATMNPADIELTANDKNALKDQGTPWA